MTGSSNKKLIFSASIVVLITGLLYLPALNNTFVNWDDGGYVYGNPFIRSLSLRYLKADLIRVIVGNWHPLTIISLALDYKLLGLDPYIYHLTNVVLHALNTFLVLIVTFKIMVRDKPNGDVVLSAHLTERAIYASIVTAFLFGLHPLHVESVAWISERKDVLSAFFFLLSILCYLKYADSRSRLHYACVLITFVLALMSKPMAVSLPIIFMIIDYYPLGRFADLKNGSSNIKWILFEKLPFFILNVISVMLTLWAQKMAIVPLGRIPFLLRMAIVPRSYLFYLYKMILPVRLAPFYPYPDTIRIFTFEYMGSWTLFFLITVLCVLAFKRYKVFLSAWLYYVITLLPAIGIVQVGDQIAADRYAYLPSLGPFILIGIGVGLLLDKSCKIKEARGSGSKRIAIPVIVVVGIVFYLLSSLTVKQEYIWKDGITLWSHEIKLYPANSRSYANRGLAYQDLKNYTRSIDDFSASIAINPGIADYYNNRGISYGSMGKVELAIKDFSKAIELDPSLDKAYNNRGFTYLSAGSYDKAIEDFKKAIKLNPENTAAYYSLASAYSKLGDTKQAESAEKAVLFRTNR